MEAFDKEYRKISNNYVVPFNHSENLNYFNTERDPEDMDALVLINKEEKIRSKMNSITISDNSESDED